MKGINFLTDENGQKTAVVIDIQTYGEKLQDFLNGLEAESWRDEPIEDFNTVIERIQADKQDMNLVSDSIETQEPRAKLMNDQLIRLYNDFLPKINKHIVNCIEACNWTPDSISKVFLMHVSDEYVSSKVKIMFVGSETHGWSQHHESDNTLFLTEFYKSVSKSGNHFNSPFWWFRSDFSSAMGVEDFMKATLWTNLSKIDVDKGKPEGSEFGELSQLFIKILIAEIAIVKPDILLIMTVDGHYKWHINNYNWMLNETFSTMTKPSGIKRNSLSNSKIDRLVVKGLLPQNSFQFQHPNSLRFVKGGYKRHANDIIKTIKDSLF